MVYLLYFQRLDGTLGSNNAHSRLDSPQAGRRRTDAEEITYLIDAYTRGEIPDYQMSAFLMAVFFSGMSDHEVDALTDTMVRSGETSRSLVHSWRQSRQAFDRRRRRQNQPDRCADRSRGGCDRAHDLGPRHSATRAARWISWKRFPASAPLCQSKNFTSQLLKHSLAFIGQTAQIAPADGKLYSLRDATATVESIPLIASSIMSKKLAVGLDALVLDVKVGNGAFMKRQVDARRLAQMMVGIGRRMNKRVQALITDMNQPLGFRHRQRARRSWKFRRLFRTPGPRI